MNRLTRLLLPTATITLILYFTLWLMSSFGGWIPDGIYLDIIRWIGEISLIAFAIKKRSLTVWIFTSMFIGAEIGLYLPELAANGKILVKYFFVALSVILPLLFHTYLNHLPGDPPHKNYLQHPVLYFLNEENGYDLQNVSAFSTGHYPVSHQRNQCRNIIHWQEMVPPAVNQQHPALYLQFLVNLK